MAEETRTADEKSPAYGSRGAEEVELQGVAPTPGSPSPPPAPWTPRMEELLTDWRSRVYAAQSAYYEEAERLHRRNYWLGIPVIVVSSMVGTAVFADWGKEGGLKWAVGSVSILAAILASLQTFLKFGENATLHGAAADWFAAIRRDIDEMLALPPELRGHPKHALDSIRQEINKASQKSPELSEHLWRRVAKRFGVEEPPLPPARAASARAAAEGRSDEAPDAGLRPRVRRKAP